MSKQISAHELAEIVSRLLTETDSTGELTGAETFSSFMTAIAKVVCDHCGGEVRYSADNMAVEWLVGIHGNDSLPDAFGGIWREYDKNGQLFSNGGHGWPATFGDGAICNTPAELDAYLEGTKPRQSPLEQATSALKLASERGGDIDHALYKSACEGLEKMRADITAHDTTLNTTEVAPTGDDYNQLMTMLGLHG